MMTEKGRMRKKIKMKFSGQFLLFFLFAFTFSFTQISGSYYTFAGFGNATIAVQSVSESAEFLFLPEPWPPSVYKHENVTNVTLEFVHILKDKKRVVLCTVDYRDGMLVGLSNPEESIPCFNSSEGRVKNYAHGVRVVEFDLLTPTYADEGLYGLVMSVNGREDNIYTTPLIVYGIPNAPTFDYVPGGNDNVTEGDNVIMTCRVSGARPPADINWTLNGSNLTHQTLNYTKGDITVSTVMFKATKLFHGKPLKCEAWNEYNEGRPTYTVASFPVQSTPDAVLETCVSTKGIYYGILSGQMQMHCVVRAYPDSERTEWFLGYDSKNLTQLNISNSDVYTVSSLTIDFHDKIVSCSATNRIGTSDLSSCKIEVQYAPVVTLQKEKTVNENDTVEVICEAEARPSMVSYEWRWKQVVVSSTKVLRIERISGYQEGLYTCYATNNIFSVSGDPRVQVTSATMNLVVRKRPRFVVGTTRKKVALIEGKPLVIMCAVKSETSIKFDWKFNGKNVNDNKEIMIKDSQDRSELTIEKTSDSYIGTYACFAVNSEGKVDYEISVLKPGKPDPLRSCSVHNQTTTQVVLICLYDYDGGDRLSVDTLIWKDGQQTSIPNLVSDSQDNKQSELNEASRIVVALPGLQSGKTFNFSIYAKNMYGRSAIPIYQQITTNVDHNIQENIRHDGDNPGAIIGGVVGGVACIAVLTLVAVVAYVKHQKDQSADDLSPIVDNEFMATDDIFQPPNFTGDEWELGVGGGEGWSRDESRADDEGRCHRASCPHHPSNARRQDVFSDEIIEDCQCGDLQGGATRPQERMFKSQGRISPQDVQDGTSLGARPKVAVKNPALNRRGSRNAIAIEGADGEKSVGVIELHIPPPPPPANKIKLNGSVPPLISFEIDESHMIDA